jgi:hypothetical protein
MKMEQKRAFVGTKKPLNHVEKLKKTTKIILAPEKKPNMMIHHGYIIRL